MIRTAGRLQSTWSRRAGYFRSIIAFAIMLLPWSPAFAQQTQPFHLITGASTNSTSVKGSAGQVVTIVGNNPNTGTAWLKFYDIATAPTCNSSTVAFTVMLPGEASSAGGGEGSVVIPLPQAVSFLNGIGICVTGLQSDTDNTAAGQGIVIDIFFK